MNNNNPFNLTDEECKELEDEFILAVLTPPEVVDHKIIPTVELPVMEFPCIEDFEARSLAAMEQSFTESLAQAFGIPVDMLMQAPVPSTLQVDQELIENYAVDFSNLIKPHCYADMNDEPKVKKKSAMDAIWDAHKDFIG